MIIELTEEQASEITDNLDVLNSILERFHGANGEDLLRITLMFISGLLE